MARERQQAGGVDVSNERLEQLAERAKPATEYITDAKRGVVYVIERGKIELGERVISISFSDAVNQAVILLQVLGAVDQAVRAGQLSVAPASDVPKIVQ